MKKLLVLIYSLMVGFGSMAVPISNVNEKVARSFRETYPKAEQVNWKEYPQSFMVYFVENGIKSNIIYGKDGSFIQSTRYYDEESLPFYLLVTVKKKFADKKIFGVTEVSGPDHIEYYIKLEDEKRWMTIKVDADGNLELVEKFNKAP
jgi:hypothetical protein